MTLKDIWGGNGYSCQGSEWHFIPSLTLNPLHIPKLLNVFFVKKSCWSISGCILSQCSMPGVYSLPFIFCFWKFIIFLKVCFELSIAYMYVYCTKYWVPLYFISLDNVICSPPPSITVCSLFSFWSFSSCPAVPYLFSCIVLEI